MSDSTAVPSEPQTVIKYMYFEDGQWVERDRPLPPPPVCMLCGAESPHLVHLPFGSKHDEEWICPACLDRAIEAIGGE